MRLATICLAPLLVAAVQPSGFGEPQVTHLAFGPDGKTLTAAYYRHATNRPGTNWGSFAVTWDLATGRPTPSPGGIGPVAYSPDGKTLATGLVERSREPAFRNRPYVRVALWTPGEARPNTALTAPTDPGPTAAGGRASDKGTVLAFAFHPAGKHLAVASADQLWWQPLGGQAQPVADLRLAPAGWRNSARLSFHDGGRVLRVTAPAASGRGKTTVVSWQVEVGEKGAALTEVGREETKDGLVGEPAVVAVSPDGATKATAAGQVVTLADARTGRVLKELRPGK